MRRFRLALVLIPSMLISVLMMPAGAHAAVGPSFTGWGSVTPSTAGAVNATAWAWTGTAWQQRSRAAGAQAYLQYFAPGWEWTWSADAGWLAMSTADVTSTADGAYVGASLPLSYALTSVTGTTLHVSRTGTATGTGSATSPLPTLAAAIGKVATGATATIIVRGGSYREGNVVIPSNKTIHVKAYPGEIPVFTGATTLDTGWTTSGATTSHSYTPMPVTDGSGISFTTGQNLTGDGVGKYPDQAWVGTQQLRQVTSLAAVTAGRFYVDRAGSRIHIAASDLGRGAIAVSGLRRFITIDGPASSLQGLRVTRFSNSASDYGVIQFNRTASRSYLRHLELTDSAFQGINLSGSGGTATTLLKGPVLENVTIDRSNWMGVGSSLVDDLVIRHSIITNSNQFDEFTSAPQSGGLKTSRNRGTRIIGNLILANHNTGLWFDQSNVDVDVVGNTIVDNGNSGIFFEISDNLLFANNYVRQRGSNAALKLSGSSGLKLVANTIVGGGSGVGIFTDNRSKPGCANPTAPLCANSYSSDRDSVRPWPSTLDWMPRLDLMIGNIIINPTGTTWCGSMTIVCLTTSNSGSNIPVQSILHHADAARGIPQTRIDGNVYATSDVAKILWSMPLGNYTSTTAFSSAMAAAPVSIAGFDATSKLGATWVNPDGTATGTLTARTAEAVAIPTNAELNQYLAAGTRTYGRIG